MDAQEIFGSDRPGVVGAMAHIGTAELGIPSIEAGLGFCMTMMHDGQTPESWVPCQAGMMHEAGCSDFGINIFAAENKRLAEDILLALAIAPRFVTLSAVLRPPVDEIRALNEAGIFVGCLVGSCRQLPLILRQLGEVAHLDFVVAEGKRSGGHNGPEDTPELIEGVIPQAKEAGLVVGIAGGIYCSGEADRAFSAGADFVQIGSAAAVSIESPANENYKKQVFRSAETVTTGDVLYHPVRSLRSPKTEELTAIEETARSYKSTDVRFKGLKDQFSEAGRGSVAAGLLKGDWQNGSFLIGTCVEHLTGPRTIQEIADEIVGGR